MNAVCNLRFIFFYFLGQQENFDVHLPGEEMIKAEIKSEASLIAMTFCLWVASKCSLLVDYNVTLDKYQFRGFGLVSQSTIELIFMENKARLVHDNAGNVLSELSFSFLSSLLCPVFPPSPFSFLPSI